MRINILNFSSSLKQFIIVVSLSSISYGSEFNPQLGKGVNASETKTYAACLTGIKTDTDTLNPALTRLYNEKRIQTREELHRALEIDASISAKGLWGSVEANVSHFSSMSISSSSLYWLVDAKYEVSTSTIKTDLPEFQLTPNAKKILSDFGIKAFYQACGTHFYSAQKIGARYSLLYEFKSNEDRSVERLAASAGGGAFGIYASAGFKNATDKFSANNNLVVHSSIIGGDHTIKDYAENPEELKKELGILRQGLYQSQKGVVLKWFIEAYDQFPEVLEAKSKADNKDLLDLFRKEALTKYYKLFMRNQDKINDLETLVRKASGDEPYYIYSEAKINQIYNIVQRLAEQNLLIQTRATECISKDAKDICLYADLRELAVTSPKADKDLSGIGGWEIYPIILTDTDDLFPYVEFQGTPIEGDFKVKIFSTNNRLFTNQYENLFVRLKHWKEPVVQIKLGSLNPVIDHKTGNHIPAICIGEFEKICNFRIIENPKACFSDGYPCSKIQLTIFDSDGFLYKKYDFFARK